MTDNKELTKEEKMQKAKELMTELGSLQLTDEELESVAGGTAGGGVTKLVTSDGESDHGH